MDLTPIKIKILESLLIRNNPTKAAELTEEIGITTPAIQMHLIGLTKKGYTESPFKGKYLISAKGKTIIGLPEITREKALAVLMQLPTEKAFHFYTGIGEPLNISAKNLMEFCHEISKVNSVSIMFHLKRGDFERWFHSLGDLELSKQMEMLKESKMKAEDLQILVRETVKNRCTTFSKLIKT
jgi:Bacterial regulatory protein, arsR family